MMTYYKFKINNRLKQVLYILAGILLLTASLALVFTKSGKELQQTLFGSYVSNDAIAIKTFVQYDPSGKPTSNHFYCYLLVNYVVENNNYSGRYLIKSFRSYDEKEANLFAKNYNKTGTHLTIYYDPKNPQESVLHQEDELHLWLYIWFFLPLLTIAVILIVWGCFL